MSVLPIALLIPTMNRPQALRRTVEGFFSAKNIPAELVVVDQSANAATIAENRAIVQAYSGDTTAVYLHSDVPSLTKARNLAVDAATQEILVFSDDDVDVYPDTLSNIYEKMSKDDIAMVAATDDSAKIGQQSMLGYLTGMRSYRRRNIGHVTASLMGRFPLTVEDETPTEWAMGFLFAVRRSLLRKWQIGWDEHLTSYAYAEDLDFSMAYAQKAKEEKLRCILSNRVHVCHLATKEYRIPTRKNTFMFVIHRYYLWQKHRLPRWYRLAMGWTNFCRMMEMAVKHEQPRDILDAIRITRHSRAAIAQGDLEQLYS